MTKQPLNIGEILRNSLGVYKAHSGMLVKFALVNILFTLLLNGGSYLLELAQSKIDIEGLLNTVVYPEQAATPEELAGLLAQSGWTDAVGLLGAGVLLMFLFIVLALTLIPKNQLAMQFYIADAMAHVEKSEDPVPTVAAERLPSSGFKSAYAKTKGKVGGLVGNTLLLGLILGACMIPLMILLVPVFIFTQAEPATLAVAMVPVMMALMAAVWPWFFLLAPMAAFKSGGNLLGKVSQIKRGNHWRVVAVSLAALLPGAIAAILALTGLHTLVVAGISAAVSLFAFGFSGAAQTLTYQALSSDSGAARAERMEPLAEENRRNAPQ